MNRPSLRELRSSPYGLQSDPLYSPFSVRHPGPPRGLTLFSVCLSALSPSSRVSLYSTFLLPSGLLPADIASGRRGSHHPVSRFAHRRKRSVASATPGLV